MPINTSRIMKIKRIEYIRFLRSFVCYNNICERCRRVQCESA